MADQVTKYVPEGTRLRCWNVRMIMNLNLFVHVPGQKIASPTINNLSIRIAAATRANGRRNVGQGSDAQNVATETGIESPHADSGGYLFSCLKSLPESLPVQCLGVLCVFLAEIQVQSSIIFTTSQEPED